MLGRKSFLSLISFISVKLLQSIVYLFAVKVFIPSNFGFQQVAISIISIFTLISTLGFNKAHIKLVSESKNKNKNFTIFFYVKILLMLIASVIIFLVILNQSINGNISDSIEQRNILIIIFLQGCFDAISSIYDFSFRGNMKIAKREIPIFISTLIGVILSLLAILILKNFYLYLISTAIASFIKLIIFIYFGKTFHFEKIEKQLLKKYLVTSIYFLFPMIFTSLRDSLGPLFFLKYYNEDLLGVYNVISNFFVLVIGVEEIFRMLLIPNFTMLLEKENHYELRSLILRFEKYICIINGIIIITGIIFAKVFLDQILGEVFFKKGYFLYLGNLIALLNFPLFGAYPSLVIAANKFKFYTFIVFFRFIFSLISWIFFIPIFNIVGINFGLWVYMIPQMILMRIYCYKKFKIGDMSKRSIFHIVVLFFIFYLLIRFNLTNLSIFYLFIISISIIIIYFIFLFSLKIIGKEDWLYLIEVINPKKMVDYVKSETKRVPFE